MCLRFCLFDHSQWLVAAIFQISNFLWAQPPPPYSTWRERAPLYTHFSWLCFQNWKWVAKRRLPCGNSHDVKRFHFQSAALGRVGFWTGSYRRAARLDLSLQNGRRSQCQALDSLPLDLIRRIFDISFSSATLHIAHPKSNQTCLELQQSRRPVRNAGLHRLDLGSLRAGHYRNSTRYPSHGLRCSTPIAVAKAGIPAQSVVYSPRTMEAQSSLVVSFRLAH